MLDFILIGLAKLWGTGSKAIKIQNENKVLQL